MLTIKAQNSEDPRQVAMKIQQFQQYLRSMQQYHEELSQPVDRSNKAKQKAQWNANRSAAFDQAYTQLDALVQTVYPRGGYEDGAPQDQPDAAVPYMRSVPNVGGAANLPSGGPDSPWAG